MTSHAVHACAVMHAYRCASECCDQAVLCTGAVHSTLTPDAIAYILQQQSVIAHSAHIQIACCAADCAHSDQQHCWSQQVMHACTSTMPQL